MMAQVQLDWLITVSAFAGAGLVGYGLIEYADHINGYHEVHPDRALDDVSGCLANGSGVTAADILAAENWLAEIAAVKDNGSLQINDNFYDGNALYAWPECEQIVASVEADLD